MSAVDNGPPTPEMMAQLEAFRTVLIKSTTYISCVYTALIYDWLVTLPQEYERFWKRKFNLTTYLFFFNRYFGLLALTTVEILLNAPIPFDRCRKVVLLEPILSLGLMLAAEALLITRVWALYDRSIWVPAFFAVMIAAEIGVSTWSLIGSEAVPIPPQLDFSICILNSSSRNVDVLWLFWFCPVVVDSCIVVLTIFRSYQLRKRAGGANVPLVKVLVRDGLIFYVCVLTANLLNVIWFKTQPTDKNQAFHSVLLLEIVTRIKGRKPDNELLSMRSPTYGEASAASISRYQTTQAGDKIFNSTSGVRSDLVPTYPLQSLRVGNDSEEGLSDPEKGFDHNPSQTTNTNIAFGGEGFEYASNTEVGRPYKGVYIQSQTS